jgi:hypothetical protein
MARDFWHKAFAIIELRRERASSVILPIPLEYARGGWQHRGNASYQGGAVRTRTRTVVCRRSANAMNGGWTSTVDARRASTISSTNSAEMCPLAQVDDPDKGCSDARCRTAKGQVVGEDNTPLRGGGFEYVDVRPANQLFVPTRFEGRDLVRAYRRRRRERCFRLSPAGSRAASRRDSQLPGVLALQRIGGVPEGCGEAIRCELR